MSGKQVNQPLGRQLSGSGGIKNEVGHHNGATRKALTRKVLKDLNLKSMASSGSDSPPQALGHREHSYG